jgi:hypothetical protein
MSQTLVAPSPKLKINHGEPPALFGRKPGNQQIAPASKPEPLSQAPEKLSTLQAQLFNFQWCSSQKKRVSETARFGLAHRTEATSAGRSKEPKT